MQWMMVTDVTAAAAAAGVAPARVLRCLASVQVIYYARLPHTLLSAMLHVYMCTLVQNF
jgi:hypothetical protein